MAHFQDLAKPCATAGSARTSSPARARWRHLGLARCWAPLLLALASSLVQQTTQAATNAPAQFSPPPTATASTNASAGLTLAGRYHPGVDLQHYWVSEKYDGVRGHWDGRRLLSRQGLPLHAPAWFTAGWPATPLDGELWAGRGQFAAAQSTVLQRTPEDSAWRQIRYMVFDLPAHPGLFQERLRALQQTVGALHQPWVQAVPQWRVDSHAQLMRQLRSHEAAGAEGLMLRRDDAPYRGGRGEDLLKLKSWEDAEATVIGHLPGKGRHVGRTGALWVQMPDGQRFRLGTGLSDAQRQQPPPVGSTVTYRYNGRHASGLPRFARFWRVRADGGAGAEATQAVEALDAPRAARAAPTTKADAP